MKKNLIILIIILIVSLLMMGNSDWHLNRNKHNKLPVGELKHFKNEIYKDETGLIWELQPAIKNKFHQPDHEVKMIENPYLGLKLSEAYDPKNPNLKFLSKTAAGGSYEAILQPNGKYLTEGKKMGTYNYGHPSGFFGSLKHTFLDVIPHFVNSNYKN
jgi:hypothetical protein